MQNYNPEEPSKYLMYYDVNNLYGWPMSQPLPTHGFRWNENVNNLDISNIPIDSPEGYILEVDLEYPSMLHDKHSDLPFCPVRDAPPGTRQKKLLATLENKERYVIHYRALQQCMRNGVVLKHIHRVLGFQQSTWLRKYIDLNTSLRAASKNEFEKNLFKLMNNAVFGKTMENVRNRVDVRLVSRWEVRYGTEAMIAKSNFHSRTIFSENLVTIELTKLAAKFDKPIYVCMSILDISKTCLYDFHYDYMLSTFGSKCKALYTDTDSLIYSIECDDIYTIMRENLARFDKSDYSPNNQYNLPLVNKKVPGLMKDENNGQIMTEFIGLRSKMYTFKVQNKIIKKAKGIKT
ncbi:uncharacterized protein [Prorops nasuta]|uniref:uncharacterized protein n=1 Tax=Prorops nasuta TaxID=863751 RepID=UPI0034CD9B43